MMKISETLMFIHGRRSVRNVERFIDIISAFRYYFAILEEFCNFLNASCTLVVNSFRTLYVTKSIVTANL